MQVNIYLIRRPPKIKVFPLLSTLFYVTLNKISLRLRIMKERLTVFAVLAVLVVSIGMTPAFGQTQGAIVVSTDKPSYADGEVILVTGEVRDRYSGLQVSIVMIAPNENRVGLAQVDVNNDKTFSHEFRAGGLMTVDGMYTVAVQYGGASNSAETTFEFGGAMEIKPVKDYPPGINATHVMIEGASDLILYEITNGRILGVTPIVDDNSLVVSIETTGDGSLQLTIPRTVLESVTDGSDDDVFILADGEEYDDYEITVTDTDRTITIQFKEGTEEIEIIGTWVIPEFGTIAAMILAIAIISIIAISARSKLSIIPRY